MKLRATAESPPTAVVTAGPAAALGVVAGEIALAVGLDPSLALALAAATTAVVGWVIRRFGLPDV